MDGIKTKSALILILLMFLAFKVMAFAPKDPSQMLKVKEIIKLVEAAKKSGFSDAQIDQLEIISDGKSYTVKDILSSISKIDEVAKYDPELVNRNTKIDLAQKNLNLDIAISSKQAPEPLKFLSSSDVLFESDNNLKAILNSIRENSEKYGY